jgi:hypothetical protein
VKRRVLIAGAVLVLIISIGAIIMVKRRAEPSQTKDIMLAEGFDHADTPIAPPAMKDIGGEDIKDVNAELPEPVVAFSERITRRLEVAMVAESPEQALRLFDELEACVSSNTGSMDELPLSVKALCMSNAERLAQARQGELVDRYHALRETAPRDVVRLIDTSSMLGVIGDSGE